MKHGDVEIVWSRPSSMSIHITCVLHRLDSRISAILYLSAERVVANSTAEEMQDFWATRASFQGGALAKKTREEEHEREVKEQASARDSRGGDRRNGGGRDRDGGRGGGRGGGGRGRGGRGGGRGGNRGGNRGGDRGGRGEREGGGNGLPPTLGSA